jgi:hypothetical protein
MEQPRFNHPLPAHTAAWLAGEITALESLKISATIEIDRNRRHYLECKAKGLRIMAGHHRAAMIRQYLKLRSVRRAM